MSGKSKDMRIMHLSRATLMICQFMIPMIEAQKKNGHCVCVCGSDDSDVRRLRELGIDVFPHKLRRGLNPFNILKEIFRIKKILVEQKIDAIVCHTPIGAGVGRIAAWLAKTSNTIYFAHGLPCAPGQNWLLWSCWFMIEKVLGFLTDAILVMNRYDEELAKKHLIKDPEKVFRIPGMGIDLEKFRNDSGNNEACLKVREELGISEEKKVVLCVAYLIAAKGVFLLMEAARQICAVRNDVFFLLAGTGPAMDKLKELIREKGLEKNFRLLGWRDDVHLLMECADVFTLPTYYFEGLPVSILEAMACSKPVIATRHRGCEDAVVDGETGFLIPIKQADTLASRILLLINDPKKRIEMGLAGRHVVEKKFDISVCTRRIVDVLERACSMKSAP